MAQSLKLWKSVEHYDFDVVDEAIFDADCRHGKNPMVMRRRMRQTDPLASVSAIHDVIEELRRRCPGSIPASHNGLFRLMNAVRHIERRPSGLAKSGRPGHFPRAQLINVAHHLKAVLAKQYQDRISLSTFIGFCLPILTYPTDVITALEKGEITRLEAGQLARLTPERLDVKPKKALTIRQELLSNHLKIQGSQTLLRRRIAELLGTETLVTSENMAAAVHQVDELLTVDDDDRRHLFYEQMKECFFAMRDIRPEEIDDPTLVEILKASDQLMAVIYKIQSRRKPQAATGTKSRRLFDV